MATFANPRALRQALAARNYDWTQVLTEAQLAIPLPAEHWGGCATLGAWLAEGAYTEQGAQYASPLVLSLLQEHEAR